MQITTRPAGLQDCDAICEIHLASIRGLGKSHYTAAEVEAWAAGRTPARYEEHITQRHVIIAQHGSTPVGFGTLDPVAGELLQLYVRPEYARQGTGSRLLAELERLARAAGLRQLDCLASLNATDFYLKAGYQPGARCKHYLRNGGQIDCIPMTKILA
jgi:GNAT superfamily N-acetyltransferase